MGQAKARGNFEQRKSESIFHENEQRRLDAWLFENASFEPKQTQRDKQRIHRCRASMAAMFGMVTSTFIRF